MRRGAGSGGPAEVLQLTVNRKPRSIPRLPSRTLLEVLRIELGLTGAKHGCGEGECGACTVLLAGEPVRSCQVKVHDVGDREVVTVEGLASDGALNPVQRAFAELGAFQCGFCTPGMVVAATALLRRNPHPSEVEVRAAMDGNVCRCCGYSRILRAITRATKLSAAGPQGSP